MGVDFQRFGPPVERRNYMPKLLGNDLKVHLIIFYHCASTLDLKIVFKDQELRLPG